MNLAPIRRGAIAALLLTSILVVAPAIAQEAPPLHISAANVTGSHGPEGDVVLLNGSVRIARGLTVITADNGRYLKNQGMLYLDGRVHMVDTTTTLHCDHASYSEDKDLLEVRGNVVIDDRGATLRAPSGTYDRARGRAELVGGVEAQDSTETLTCERLTYLRDSLRVEARGAVRGITKKDRMTLQARAVDYDRSTHLAVATGEPLLETRDAEDRLTTVTARRLLLNSQTRLAEAFDSVVVRRDSLRATGQRARFDDAAERGWLFGEPRAWDDETVVTGDTLEVWTEKRVLRRFVVRSDATIDYHGRKPQTAGEASLLKGDRIEVFFTDEKIDSLIALKDAHNEYQSVPRVGKTPEVNLAQGDTITVHFRAGKLDRAVVRGQARGEYHFAVAMEDTAAARSERVRYDAARIDYLVPKNRIVLDGHSRLFYRWDPLESTCRHASLSIL